MNKIASRFLGFVDYAIQTALMRSTPAKNISQHKEFAKLENQFTDLPGVSVNPVNAGSEDEIWLSVARLYETEPPVAQDSHLAAWLKVSRNPAKAPTLLEIQEEKYLIERGLLPAPPPKEPQEPSGAVVSEFKPMKLAAYEKHLTDTGQDSLAQRLKSYLKVWNAWATKEKEIRKSVALYKELFLLSQTLQGNLLDTPLELVWGIGMAVQQLEAGNIAYPLITQYVELRLNEETMAMEVIPSGPTPALSLELFASLDNPGVVALEEAGKKFFATGTDINPDSPATFESLLRKATTLLDASGVYVPDLPGEKTRNLPKPAEHLAVTDTWVIMARPRTANLMIQDLERFATAVKDGTAPDTLPSALSALFTDPSSELIDVELPPYRGLTSVAGSSRDGGDSSPKPAELYFPKAYNDEQVQIIQMLDVHNGVVVQGPPGTGKTHTIANVICHYLASGKRVLVTSMKDPALAVLQEKLPEVIRPLAISLLTSEADGMRQFDHAISTIAAELTRIDRNQYRRDIETTDAEIDSTHAKLAKLDGDIAIWARLNLDPVTLDDEKLTPVQVAEQVSKFGTDADWFPDALDIDTAYAPVFGTNAVIALRAARVRLGDDIAYLGAKLPETSSLPDSARLYQAHQDLQHYEELKKMEDSRALPRLAVTAESMAKAADLIEALRDLHEKLTEIEADPKPWAHNLQAYLRKHSRSEVLDILMSLKKDIQGAVTVRKQFLARPIEGFEPLLTDPELMSAIDNLTMGKKPFGLSGLFGKNDAKRKLDEVTVTGVKPSTGEEWTHVKEYLLFLQGTKKLISRWNSLAQEISLPQVDNFAAIERADQYIDLLQHCIGAEKAANTAIVELIPTWSKAGQLPLTADMAKEASGILQQHMLKHRLSDTWKVKEELINTLKGCAGDISDKLYSFATKEFGSTSLPETVLPTRWAQLTQELETAYALVPDLRVVQEVTAAIEAQGAPLWADMLRTAPADQTYDALIPDNWAAVWRIRRLATCVSKMDGRAELKRLTKLRGDLEHDLASLYQKAVTTRTWLRLKENVTPDVAVALEAYRTSIKKIGKGTGVRAGRFRKDAREAAEKANKAIPCWIMPHFRISESLPATFGDFDLVIIDEASQSDLTALPAIMRAKKILVVGDDKQVSPDGIGLVEEKIKALRHRFLGDQVSLFAPQMTPDRSVYDLFKVVFSSSCVMLREHFRCVAPIIEYSKREFYKHELRPLRMPRQSERLDPPLVDVYVPHGGKRGDLNLAEADYIINEIRSIVENPALMGRTIGVVSLIGNKQALLIMQRVTEELGEDVVTKFKITCGDARTFQGKERDIMFLSMIASPGDAHPQTQVSAEQRFNVAASRARDRMYLVRSVRLEDLRPADTLRTKLIQHFQAPFLQNEQDLSSNREKCESPFEREVYDILVEKGYRVIPQVPVGQFRIDMVVEGDNDNRLAIECDGDRYHGPDQWDNDMRRQRILERAGWTFWRSFASTFVTHREQVVADLIDTLTRLGITPVTGEQEVNSIHTEYREVPSPKAQLDEDLLEEMDELENLSEAT
ncbi:MAG: AAA family ATPase [Acidovorax sp.]|jgi:very-short-patch-repair endonuclease/Cdc6-like AAA superfamily ATPase|nr:AAA family ATPase [Acidovorax sp.]